MWAKYLWLVLFELFLNLHIIFSDEDCQVTQKPKLQIVFVVDQVLKVNNDRWTIAQNVTVLHLYDLFKQNNFQAEYAVTGFVDYPDTAYRIVGRGITDPELCYFLMQELTTDKIKVVDALSKDLFIRGYNNHSTPGMDSDSLTTAMLFSAVDKRLKWNSGFYDKQCNLVRKFMIPMIYKRNSNVLTSPGNRKPPKADGTDTCTTALIPQIEQLNQVLFDHQFAVINSMLKFRLGLVAIETIYAELFASLFIPYYQSPVPEAGKWMPANETDFDAKAYAKRLYDFILQEAMSCDWEDPVGYNSLGL